MRYSTASRRMIVKYLLGISLVIALAACSDDAATTNTAGLAACTRIGERCHDSTSLVGMDCHRYGHSNNAAVCLAREAECLAACPVATDAGATDAGATDAGATDAGTLCQRLGSLCHSSTTAVGEACHLLGHENDAAMCAAREAECVAECSPRDGG